MKKIQIRKHALHAAIGINERRQEEKTAPQIGRLSLQDDKSVTSHDREVLIGL